MLNDKFITLICACFIAGLEAIALSKGMNGICLSISIGSLAGLGGYTVRKIYKG